jgi:hypothetical protein
MRFATSRVITGRSWTYAWTLFLNTKTMKEYVGGGRARLEQYQKGRMSSGWAELSRKHHGMMGYGKVREHIEDGCVSAYDTEQSTELEVSRTARYGWTMVRKLESKKLECSCNSAYIMNMRASA